jgi:hypothetical protein
MPWRVHIHAERSIVETRYAGEVSEAELEEAGCETIVRAVVSGSRLILADCQAMTGGHRQALLESLVENFHTNTRTRRVKEAVVLPADAEAAASVTAWRRMCRSHGLEVDCFDDRESAIAWLLG